MRDMREVDIGLQRGKDETRPPHAGGLAWEQVTPLSLRSGDWWISKCMSEGKWKYVLWDDREIVGVFDSCLKAKEAAK